MALAVVGVRVKIDGAAQSIAALRAVRREMEALGRAAQSLTKVSIRATRVGDLTSQSGNIQVGDTRNINKTSSAVNNYTKNVTNAAMKTGLFTRAFSLAGAQVRKLGRQITTFGSVLSTLGFRMSALISIPIIGMFAGIVSVASKFEDSMVSLITKVGISTSDVNTLTDAFIRLAPELGVGPVELLDAAYQPLSRELRDIATVIDIVTLAAKAQAVGFGDINEIAKVATSVMIAYGKGILDSAGQIQSANEIMDKFVVAVQRGSLEADEFVEPLGRVLGTASNLGVELDEILAIAGTFGAAGTPVGQVFTGINRILLTFLKPTEKAKEALDRIFDTVNTGIPGIKALNTMLGEEGLARTLIALVKGAEALDIPLSDIIGRVTGLNAALFVTGGAADLYLNTLEHIKNANGELETSFEIVSSTTSFRFKQLTAQLQVLAITLGDVLLPPLNLILQRLIPIIATIGRFAKLHPKIVLVAMAFALVAAAVGPAVVIIGLLVSSIGAIATAFGSVIGLVASLTAGLGPLIALFLGLGTILTGLFLFTLPVLIRKTFGNMDKLVNEFFIWGKSMVGNLANGIIAGIVFVVNALTKLGNAIAEMLSPGSPPRLLPELRHWGANIIEQLLEGMTLADFSTFDKIADIMSGFFKSLGEDIFGEDNTGLIPAILTSRNAIMKAIEEARRTGGISQDTLDEITMFTDNSFQPQLVGRIQDYIRTLVDLQIALDAVSEATAEIDRINAAFEESVAPLNDRLSEITDRYDEVKRAQERARLEKILADPRAPELARELAFLGLEELDLKEQVRIEEAARDVALEAAQAQLLAAEMERDRLAEVADLQLAAIQFYIDQNNLIREQDELLARIEERNKKAKEDLDEIMSSLAGGPGQFLPDDVSIDETLFDLVAAGLDASLTNLKKQINGFVTFLDQKFEKLKGPLKELQKQWVITFDMIIKRVQKVVTWLDELEESEVVGFLLQVAGAALILNAFLAPVGGLVGAVKALFIVMAMIPAAATGIIKGFAGILLAGGPVTILLGVALFLVGANITKYGGLKEALGETETAFRNIARMIVSEFFPEMGRAELASLNFWNALVLINGAMAVDILEAWFAFKAGFVDPFMEWIGDAIEGAITLLNLLNQILLRPQVEVPDIFPQDDDEENDPNKGTEQDPIKTEDEEEDDAVAELPDDGPIPAALGILSGVLSGVKAPLPTTIPHTATTSQTSLNFGDVNISNGMDQAVFEARVRQIIAQAMR